MQNIRGYKIGTVPFTLSEQDGNGMIIMLTCVCDLNGFIDDARLDYEVVAHSESGATYSIDHGSIGTFQRMESKEERQLYTYKNNEPLNVWDLFKKDVLQKDYITDKGGKFNIYVLAVDTGNFTYYANTFIDQCQELTIPYLTIGVKGDTEKVRRLNANTPRFKKSSEKTNLYLLDVNQLKDELADRIELKWDEGFGLMQPEGFMNFPESADGKYQLKSYFSQFESEIKVQELNSDGSEIGHIWKKKHSTVKNHFWDIRVYTLAIRDIFVNLICKEADIKEPDWAKYIEIFKAK